MAYLFMVLNLLQSILSWSIRLGIVWFIVTQVTPAPFRLQIDTPQTLHTEKSQVCVHTDLIHEVDEWKIQHSLQLVREMGASTIVEFFPWAYVEGTEGVYDWAQTDRIIYHAQNQDIRIIARMGLVPEWARPDESTLNTLPPEADVAFAEFISDFAARYVGIIDHIIIWNEPNLAFEWGFEDFTPERYTDLLRVVYPSVKQANPDAIVMAGALAPTLEPATSDNGLNDLIYLERMYQAGAGDYFDALSIHTYGFDQSTGAEPQFDALNFRRAELLRVMMTNYGDDNKPVYITESGWNDSPSWVYGVRSAQRIAYTLEAFRKIENDWTWAESLCIWILRHPTPRNNYRDYYTLITPDFQLKPIYTAIQAYARGWQAEDTPLWLPPPTEDDES
jgi:hypothetical protein